MRCTVVRKLDPNRLRFRNFLNLTNDSERQEFLSVRSKVMQYNEVDPNSSRFKTFLKAFKDYSPDSEKPKLNSDEIDECFSGYNACLFYLVEHKEQYPKIYKKILDIAGFDIELINWRIILPCFVWDFGPNLGMSFYPPVVVGALFKMFDLTDKQKIQLFTERVSRDLPPYVQSRASGAPCAARFPCYQLLKYLSLEGSFDFITNTNTNRNFIDEVIHSQSAAIEFVAFIYSFDADKIYQILSAKVNGSSHSRSELLVIDLLLEYRIDGKFFPLLDKLTMEQRISLLKIDNSRKQSSIIPSIIQLLFSRMLFRHYPLTAFKVLNRYEHNQVRGLLAYSKDNNYTDKTFYKLLFGKNISDENLCIIKSFTKGKVQALLPLDLIGLINRLFSNNDYKDWAPEIKKIVFGYVSKSFRDGKVQDLPALVLIKQLFL